MSVLRFFATFVFTLVAVGGFCLFATAAVGVHLAQGVTTRLTRRTASV